MKEENVFSETNTEKSTFDNDKSVYKCMQWHTR